MTFNPFDTSADSFRRRPRRVLVLLSGCAVAALVMMLVTAMWVGPVEERPEAASAVSFVASAVSFVELHKETWGTIAPWKLYVLRHRSGACFVAVDPPGDGGGDMDEVDSKVCEYYLSGVERK